MSFDRTIAPLRPDHREAARMERRSWQRAVACHAIASANGRKLNPSRVLKAEWPSDTRAELILRSAVSPTDTTTFPGFDAVTAFRAIAPGSAALKLFTHDGTLRLDMKGLSTIGIPELAALPPTPVFIAEGAPAPAVEFTLAKAVLGPVKKILLLSAASAEIENATPQGAVAVIGKVMADRSNASIDATVFDANPASDIRPAGLLNGVAAIAPSAATDPVDAMAEDISNLAGTIADAGIDVSDVVFIAPPREWMMLQLRSGSNFRSEVLPSAGVAAKTVIAVAPAGLSCGYDGVPTIETSKEACIHYEDTAPADISGSGALATPTRSFFQTDVVGIRLRSNLAFAAARGAVAYVEGVSW
ncbi:hypothetical protein QA639_25465 [Bradyrhizobium pachyrhizi]|uniref:hypothetical protein n=1 Tax=Bradyrhizobium pachyrhizi TaxID=280333 RepID=UPI0024B1E361|nr:hypothetical protein [Bradyrhizobium pachyrhizi]WFU53024.1 hypothetical protein QA639_25465 [Bradyrhizobium pachyrhizi]